MKIIVLSLIGILLISMSSYSFSQSNYVPGLTVTTNDKSYDEGDNIVISGKVSSVIEDTPIIIQLWKDSDIIDISQMNPDQDGHYSHTIIAEGQIWTQGTYVVKASYGEGNIAETIFTFGHFESVEESTDQTTNLETRITIVMDDTKFYLDSANRIVRASIEIQNYTPSHGIYLIKITHLPTQQVLKTSEIYPRNIGNDLWGTQIAYPFLESDITIGDQTLFGEFEIHIRTEFGSKTASTKFSIFESQYGPESRPSPEAVVVETPEAVVASTPEIVGEDERVAAADETVQSEESGDDFTSVLPYLGIIIAAIIGGVISMKIRNNKKNDELSEDYEYNAEEYSVIENAPMTKKFQDMQTETQSYNENFIPLDQVIESKIQIISILQENKIGDYAKLDSIKISLFGDGTFTQEDNEYLEEKYEEFIKITKPDSEDKSE